MVRIINFIKKRYYNYLLSSIPLEVKDEITKLGEIPIKVISNKCIESWEYTFTEYYWETFWKDLWIIQTKNYIFKISYTHCSERQSKFRDVFLGAIIEEKTKIN